MCWYWQLSEHGIIFKLVFRLEGTQTVAQSIPQFTYHKTPRKPTQICRFVQSSIYNFIFAQEAPSLLNRMQLTGTAWVKSRTTRDDGRCKTYTPCQKRESLLFHDLSTGPRLLGDPFLTSFNSNARTAVTSQNTTDSNCIISHARNTTDIQPNVLFNGNTSVTWHKQQTQLSSA